MILSHRTKTRINLVILSISFVFWIVLLLNTREIIAIGSCHIADSGITEASLNMLLVMNPIHSLLAGWVLMVIAMMLPKLISPIQSIYSRSFKHLRFTLALSFVFGYVAIWTLVGVFMNVLILGSHLLMPNSYIPALIVGLVGTIWQFSPMKQHCLNEGHNHANLSAFGWQAIRDAVTFGLVHGGWCVGAGWALMLFPMILPYGHTIAMLIVTFIMFSEHLEHPQKPSWRINFRPKLLYFIVAQLQNSQKNLLKRG